MRVSILVKGLLQDMCFFLETSPDFMISSPWGPNRVLTKSKEMALFGQIWSQISTILQQTVKTLFQLYFRD